MTALDQDVNLITGRVGILDRGNLLRLDWITVALTIALAAIGFTVLYSASTGPVAVDYPHWKQGARFAMGAVLALIIVCIDYRVLISLSPVFYALSIVTLAAVLSPQIGTEVKGGQHWIVLFGPVRFQPSELSKLALVFMLAWYLSRIGPNIRRFGYFLLTFVIWGGLVGLVVAQKDLGTAITMGPLLFAMLIVAGCKWRHIAIIIIAGLAAIPIAYSQLEPYQRSRVDSFINPEKANPNDSFQTLQAKIAIGSGQMWGKGFGNSTQTHLSYLPEFHTDFVFALLAEEFGFVGAATVIVLLGLFLIRGLSLAVTCPDPAGRLLVVGAVSILACHILVNIAITLNLMPVTGLPLPFLSYGGSFYLTVMMCVGTILTVHARRRFFD
jgi:rod shape determining protein RodA